MFNVKNGLIVMGTLDTYRKINEQNLLWRDNNYATNL